MKAYVEIVTKHLEEHLYCFEIQKIIIKHITDVACNVLDPTLQMQSNRFGSSCCFWCFQVSVVVVYVVECLYTELKAS